MPPLEVITRHRGGGFDSNDNPISWVDAPVTINVVAPGASPEYIDRGRNGERVECSVYVSPAVDVINADEVTVRGSRFQVQVDQWRNGDRSGTVILCSRGAG